MKSMTYSAARENLAATMQQVCDDCEPVIITRKGDQAVVIMSLDDYQSLHETAYLMRSPENSRRLRAAINQLESGGVAE
ncbi:type II toxin-antitoxin system Phd/YefM family antitoxin [Haloferula chungangensis]|uniref:Antitoxin n=1 Tax=Haloferula chungangensis TaxID=1048331 RepID=A0ABW2L9P8_9BACT